MKKLFFCTMLFLLGSVSFVFAQQTVPSQIKEVTLFSRQALIKRVASASVQKGLNELQVEIEPFHIDTDSVQADVFGSGEIFSVQFKEIPIKESPQENIAALEAKISELKKSKKTLSDQKLVLEKEELFLSSLIDFSKTEIPKEIKTNFPNMEDINKTLSFLHASFKKINEERHALDASIEQLQKKIKVLKAELNALRRPGKKSRKIIQVLFNAKGAQTIRIEATYLVKNASWKPLYKVAVSEAFSGIDLTMFSKILQKSGENWRQVNLSISNVIPLSGVRLPSLPPWIIDLPRPRTKLMRKPGRIAMEKAAPLAGAVSEEDAFDIPKEKAEFTAAVKKELPFSFEYKIPQLIDIESRDKETIIPLLTKKLTGDFYYYSIPKQNHLTFLVCKAKADKELLSGPLNVYFAGRYIGKTFLKEKRAGEEFKLSLGADREIKVKREKIKDKIKETFLGKIERNTIIRTLAYKITVENIKSKPVKLKVLDSIPVSKTDKVEVKDLKMSPDPTEKDYLDKEGVMLWEYTLKPEVKQEINIEFIVTYPKNLLPTGL